MASSRCAGLSVRARARRTRSRAESLSAGSIDSLFIPSPDPSGALTHGGFLCIRSSTRLCNDASARRRNPETARRGILSCGYEGLPPRRQGHHRWRTSGCRSLRRRHAPGRHRGAVAPLRKDLPRCTSQRPAPPLGRGNRDAITPPAGYPPPAPTPREGPTVARHGVGAPSGWLRNRLSHGDR